MRMPASPSRVRTPCSMRPLGRASRRQAVETVCRYMCQAPMLSTHKTRRRLPRGAGVGECIQDRKSTRLNSSHLVISYAVFCLKKKKKKKKRNMKKRKKKKYKTKINTK